MRRLFHVLAPWVVSAAAWGAVPDTAPKPDPADKSPESVEARNLLKQGKSDQALALLDAAFRKDPSLGPAQLQLAKILFATGNGQQGRMMLEQAASKHPDNPDVLLAFAGLAVGEKRVADAQSHYERVWQLASADASLPAARRDHYRQEYLSGLTSVAELRLDWKAAEKNLRAWLALKPGSGRVHQGLARALFFQDPPAGSEAKEAPIRAELAKAYAADPALEVPAVVLSRLYAQAGDKARAAERMFEALREDSRAPTARVRLSYADWLLREGRAAEAMPYARQAVELDVGGKWHARRLLGLLLRYQRDYKAAEECFEELLKESPADFFLSNQLALSLVEQGGEAKTRRAMELASVNLRQFPLSLEANSTAGWVFYRAGRIDEAERLLNAALSAGQPDADTGYFYCHVLAARNRLEDCRKILDAITKTTGPFVYRPESEAWLKRLKPEK